MQILAETGKITGGEVVYRGEDIAKWNSKQMAGVPRRKAAPSFSRIR